MIQSDIREFHFLVAGGCSNSDGDVVGSGEFRHHDVEVSRVASGNGLHVTAIGPGQFDIFFTTSRRDGDFIIVIVVGGTGSGDGGSAGATEIGIVGINTDFFDYFITCTRWVADTYFNYRAEVAKTQGAAICDIGTHGKTDFLIWLAADIGSFVFLKGR